MQELVETKKEPDLDLKIVNTETKTITIPFKKNQKKIAPPAPPPPPPHTPYKAYFLQYKNRKE